MFATLFCTVVIPIDDEEPAAPEQTPVIAEAPQQQEEEPMRFVEPPQAPGFTQEENEFLFPADYDPVQAQEKQYPVRMTGNFRTLSLLCISITQYINKNNTLLNV